MNDCTTHLKAAQLIAHRRSLRLTQEQCALMIGFSQPRYCTLERNGVWNRKTARRLRRLLGLR